jgi:hypothetical protein
MYTNVNNLSLSVAVWLANDTYDYDSRKNYVSATTLIRNPKQVVLGKRVNKADYPIDIATLVPSRTGTAVHDSIEKAWHSDDLARSLKRLGFSDKIASNVVVNPTTVEQGQIPVYMEIRSEREIDGYIVAGKFDFVAEGRLEDFKHTSTYTYTKQVNDEKFRLQGSIYRWLNPDIITEDYMLIQYIFKDFSPARVGQPNYPPTPSFAHKISLMSHEETDTYIRNRIAMLKSLENVPEHGMPLCSDEDLWRDPSEWKVYKDSKSTRAVNGGKFDSLNKAQVFVANKGGIIKEIKAKVRACKFCPAFPICEQKDQYIASGELEITGLNDEPTK